MRLRLLAALVVALGFVARPGVLPTRAQTAPTMEQFIEIVRGHDAATIRRTFPAYNVGLFAALFGAGDGIPLVTEEQRALFTNQTVVTPAGSVVDVGHVITGIEAGIALPPAARAAQAVTGCSIVAAVTWSGDVGQALHDYARAGGTGDPAPSFDVEAPPEDLLGDVDGWLLAGLAESYAAMGATDIGEMLTRAYLLASIEPARFNTFAAGLSGGDGTLLSEAARASIHKEITCFARALAAFTGSGVTAEAIEQAAPYFVERFIAYLEEGRKREA